MSGTTEISTARRGAAIGLASDTTLTGCRALYVGVTGDVKVDLVDGGTGITFKAHPVGYLLAQATKVYSTANGTTATDLVALF